VGTDKAAMEVVLARGYPDAPKSQWSVRRWGAVIGSLAVVLGGAIIAANLLMDRQAPTSQGPAPKIVVESPAQKDAAPQPMPAPPPATGPGDGVPPVVVQPKATPPKSPPAATYRVLANVSSGYQNLRSGPAVKYPIVIPIPAGATGIVLGACRLAEDNTKPWCQATWQGLSGWISSCCIVDEKTGAPPKIN
jgi:hypothetical protein